MYVHSPNTRTYTSEGISLQARHTHTHILTHVLREREGEREREREGGREGGREEGARAHAREREMQREREQEQHGRSRQPPSSGVCVCGMWGWFAHLCLDHDSNISHDS